MPLASRAKDAVVPLSDIADADADPLPLIPLEEEKLPDVSALTTDVVISLIGSPGGKYFLWAQPK
jgi:hypothetical protein